MSKAEFYEWAERNGWEQDRWGHLSKGEYRLKVQARSVRLERRYKTTATEYSPSETRYVRLRGAYFSALSLDGEGKLQGMKM
jgi:hypothetical protein